MTRVMTRDELLAAVPRKHEGINWHAYAYVEKYSPDQEQFATRMLARHRPGVLKAHHSVANGALREALEKYTGAPEDGTAEAAGNLLTTMGLTTITALLIGAGGTGALFNIGPSAKPVCGVGATATAAAVTDVALGANGTSAWYQAMDPTFPTVSAGVMTGQTTFASGDANFAWNEWCWASGSGTVTASATFASVYATAASRSMWNHKIASLGTKASGAAWVFTTTITLS